MENLQSLITQWKERAAPIEKRWFLHQEGFTRSKVSRILQEKSEELNAVWKAFYTAENIISNDPTLDEDDPYIAQDIHKSMGAVHSATMDELGQLIENIQTKPLPADCPSVSNPSTTTTPNDNAFSHVLPSKLR